MIDYRQVGNLKKATNDASSGTNNPMTASSIRYYQKFNLNIMVGDFSTAPATFTVGGGATLMADYVNIPFSADG